MSDNKEKVLVVLAFLFVVFFATSMLLHSFGLWLFSGSFILAMLWTLLTDKL